MNCLNESPIVSDFWNDDVLTEHLRGVTVPSDTIGRIDAFIASMVQAGSDIDARAVYRFGKALRADGFRDLEQAVREDIARNFSDGRRSMPYRQVGTTKATSFRMGMVSMMDMIAIDYDGTADGVNGNAKAVKELAHEMYVMAIEGYANIPSLYYPRETDGSCWVIRNLMAHATTLGQLRIPLEAIGLTADEIVAESSSRSSLVADAWWGQMLHDRADIVRSGQVFPLRTEFVHQFVERYPEAVPGGMSLRAADSGQGTYFGTDEGIILGCANAITYFETVENQLSELVEKGDIPVLCAIVDKVVDCAGAAKTILLGIGKEIPSMA